MTSVWRLWVVFLKHGGGALGIFKSPVCTYNQAWTFSLSASYYFSFLSKRSGRRMPPASEAPCINIPRSRPLRTTCSAYPSTSQPFSARNSDEKVSCWGKEPSFAFFSFCDVLFLFLSRFISFFRFFTFFQLRVRVLLILLVVRFWFSFLFVSTKTRVCFFFFPLLSFFVSFCFSFFVPSDARGQGYVGSSIVFVAAPQPTAIIQQHHIIISRKLGVRVFVNVESSQHRWCCSSQSKSWHWGVPTAR